MDNPLRLLVCALALVACGQASAPAPSPSPAPRSGGVAVVADWEAASGFDVFHARSEPDLRLGALVYSALWDLDGRGRPVPRLARAVPSPHWEAGAITLDVSLRAGLRWSDGSALVPADVVRAVRAAPGQVASAEEVGPLQVRLRLAPGLDAPITAGAGLRPLPPGGPGSAFSGPFQPAPAPPGEFRVERNRYYFGPPALLDAVVFRTAPSHDALQAAVAAGAVDVAFHFGPAEVGALGLAGSAPVPATSSRTVLLNPNHAAGPWAGDERVLEALSLAVDREALAAGNVPSAAPFPAAHPSNPPRDLARAAAELDADGWRAGPDGIRTKAGFRLAFRLEAACEDPWAGAALDRLRLEWRDAGASVETTCRPRASLLAEGASGHFQMQLYSQDLGWEPGAWVVLAQPGPENWNRCQDQTLDSLLRARDYARAAAEWQTYSCTIPLYQERHVTQVSRALRGFDPGSSPSPETWNASGWWVDSEASAR